MRLGTSAAVACATLALSAHALDGTGRSTCLDNDMDALGCTGYPSGTYVYRDWVENSNINFRCLNKGDVSFMFSLGPREGTEGVLDTLKTFGVRATFFVNGAYLNVSPSAEHRALLKRMEAEGHAIAYNGNTWDALHSTTADTFAAVWRDEFEGVAAKVGNVVDTKYMFPGFYPKYESYSPELVVGLAGKGVRVVFPNLDILDLKDEDDESIAETEIAAGNYAQLNTRLASLVGEPEDESFIVHVPDSYENSGDMVEYLIKTFNDKNYNIVDMHTCIEWRDNEDVRAQRCMGGACPVEGECRGKFKECGTEFCDAEDAIWITECADDPSLAAAATEAPTASEVVETTSAPTKADVATPSPTPKEIACGTPCDLVSECRSKDNACGRGASFCNDDSLWQPACLAITEPPTGSDNSTKSTECSGRPCSIDTDCRRADGVCGAGPGFCNQDAIWSLECNDDTGSAARSAVSVLGAVAVVLALAL